MKEYENPTRTVEVGEDGISAFLDIIWGLSYLLVVFPVTALYQWWKRKHV